LNFLNLLPYFVLKIRGREFLIQIYYSSHILEYKVFLEIRIILNAINNHVDHALSKHPVCLEQRYKLLAIIRKNPHTLLKLNKTYPFESKPDLVPSLLP
jgi:hypothetical protein